MKRYLAIVMAMTLPVLAGCDDRFAAVNEFYSKNVTFDDQKTAIKKYDAKQKWHIFVYGAARGEDYAILLAPTVAEDGKAVLDAAEDDLTNGNPELHYLSANLLFTSIQESKTYDICGDAPLYARLQGYAEDIRSLNIKGTYLHALEELCAPVKGEGVSVSEATIAAP
jgi:hypothetical protein